MNALTDMQCIIPRRSSKCKYNKRINFSSVFYRFKVAKMSSVFYRFKVAKTTDTYRFDGPGISVFDLKKEIMLTKKLGKGQDFDLILTHANTNEGIPSIQKTMNNSNFRINRG